MRSSIPALFIALGRVIALPAVAQQMTPGNQRMQEDANKGVKTRNSGESGYVASQEKQGAGARVPGQSDKSQTTGSNGGTANTPSGGKSR
ncbi:hypothetical protein [Bradyrhizobium sp. Ai1a-2]|uniref:hypothetical protein n=1 Tax=Bradyrhizobium sp. Ai1a-2 TaxID=196490 RepID=UPI0003FFA3F8|nr:hypothetical protein [Bradyrhizobium sp. Ai1a-2]